MNLNEENRNMEREVFKSHPLRGIPMGLIRGFMYGCLILLIALAFGMDEDKFLPLLGAAAILGGIIGMICSTGKRIEADANGIYLKNKAYLLAENDMYFQVFTHFYSGLPVTERWIRVNGQGGKHTVKCTFLNRRDAGRLARILEDGMRKKYRTEYDGFELKNAAVRSFTIPAAELAEKIDKRIRLLTKTMFWFLTVLFSWILISMAIKDQLEDHGIGLLLFMIMNVAILGGVNLFVCRRFKQSAQKIPREIVFCGGTMYVDEKSFGSVDITRVVMTPERGAGTGDMRKLVLYDTNGNSSEYSFGFRYDQKGYPEYGQLAEAVKEHFGNKFSYDIH